jgi:hypothetical protein
VGVKGLEVLLRLVLGGKSVLKVIQVVQVGLKIAEVGLRGQKNRFGKYFT